MKPSNASLIAVVLILGAVQLACGRDAQTYLDSGNKLFEQKSYREAAVQFQNAIKRDPANGQAHYKLARSILALGDGGSAVKSLVRAADLMPQDAGVQLEAARALLATGQYEDARSRAEQLLLRDPKNVEAHILRGNATAGMKDFDSALTNLQSALQLDATRPGTYLNLASVQLAKGRYLEAEASYKQAIAANPKSVLANLALADFYWVTGKREESERWVKAAAVADPNSILANRALARLSLMTNNVAEAEAPLKLIADRSGRLEDRLTLGDYYVSSRKHNLARAVFESMLTETNAASAAGARLAGVEYEQGNRGRAHQLIDQVIARDSANGQARVVKGGWLLSEGKVEEALAVADAAIKADPRFSDGHALMGAVLAKKHDIQGAVTAYSQVIALNPTAVNVKIEVAQLHLAAGNYQQALQMANEAVGNRPNSGLARLVLARAHVATGDLGKALQAAKALESVAPDSPDVHILLGEIALRKGHQPEAKTSFERALQIYPNSIEALSGLARADLALGNTTQAARRLDAELSKRPEDSDLMLLAARAHLSAGTLEPAERLLKRAITLNPSLLEGYHLLGQIYVRQSKLDAARLEYEALATRQPDLIPAHTMVALILTAQNKLDEARMAYERILALDSHAAVAANNLAYLDAEAGQNLAQALSRAQVAKARLPDNADVNDTLGWVFYKQGLATSAIPPLEQSVAKDAQNPTYHYHLGLAYLKAGNKTKARETLERALKLSDKFDGAAEARKALASLQS